MTLFPPDPSKNLLPFDGIVHYFGQVLEKEAADDYFNIFYNAIAWKHDEAFIFGKHYVTKRKVAWYGDRPFEYAYSNATKRALPWTKELTEIKELTEKYSGARYNSCLLNLYHDGAEGMAYHSDDEKNLAPMGTIASVTFGAERKFAFRHKRNGETVSMYPEHGSLLVMKGATQLNWKHRLPPTKKVDQPRINLTFRTIIG